MSAYCPAVTISDDNHVSDFSAIAARLVEAACLARDGDGEAAKVHIARAMALLCREPSTIPADLRPLNGCTREVVRGGLAAWRRRRLISYIDAHLAESVRVADLARLLGLSERHFSHAFRCTFSTSAHEYLTRRRIEVAKGLMLMTREPLCEIALRAGLCDQSHLTRVFRRIVGDTPCAWRRARWGEVQERPPHAALGPERQAASDAG